MRPVSSSFAFAGIPRLPRVNLYGPIHKGLRFGLCRMLTRMGGTDWTDDDAVDRLAVALDEILSLCASHLEAEELFVRPMLERRNADIAFVNHMHAQHRETIVDLRGRITDLQVARPDARAALGRSLYLGFSHFVGENLAHMVEEELHLEPLLESLYEARELAAMHEALVASFTPEEKLASARVMLPALTQEERFTLLAEARAALPPGALEAILREARAALTEDEVRDLTRRLGVAA